MGKVTTFFFDSYAFFEIIEGNRNYKNYTKNIAIITTKLNLMELHYGLLRRYGKKTADEYYNKFKKYTIDISDEVIKKANDLKMALRQRKFSYIDCVGYILAITMNIKFLTGDKEFKHLNNVEYVR
jgi:uncharacterized protein